MKRRKALIAAVVLVAAAAAIAGATPAILRAAGLHPHYAGVKYDLAGKRAFIVDAGEGSNRNIQLARIPSKPDALLLTHFHSDHIVSLGDIALGHWGRNVSKDPLVVIGPPGVDILADGMPERSILGASVVELAFAVWGLVLLSRNRHN